MVPSRPGPIDGEPAMGRASSSVPIASGLAKEGLAQTALAHGAGGEDQ